MDTITKEPLSLILAGRERFPFVSGTQCEGEVHVPQLVIAKYDMQVRESELDVKPSSSRLCKDI